jgi:hypothetical protein
MNSNNNIPPQKSKKVIIDLSVPTKDWLKHYDRLKEE